MLNNIKTRVINILDYFVDDLDSLCSPPPLQIKIYLSKISLSAPQMYCQKAHIHLFIFEILQNLFSFSAVLFFSNLKKISWIFYSNIFIGMPYVSASGLF